MVSMFFLLMLIEVLFLKLIKIIRSKFQWLSQVFLHWGTKIKKLRLMQKMNKVKKSKMCCEKKATAKHDPSQARNFFQGNYRTTIGGSLISPYIHFKISPK